jgi:hypothetical protein
MPGVQRAGTGNKRTRSADIERFGEIKKCRARAINAANENGNLQMDTGRASALGWG